MTITWVLVIVTGVQTALLFLLAAVSARCISLLRTALNDATSLINDFADWYGYSGDVRGEDFKALQQRVDTAVRARKEDVTTW